MAPCLRSSLAAR